jgi:hypothetical protein
MSSDDEIKMLRREIAYFNRLVNRQCDALRDKDLLIANLTSTVEYYQNLIMNAKLVGLEYTIAKGEVNVQADVQPDKP